MDPRIITLAKNLVNYSCRLKKGEKVWIDAIGVPHDLPIAIVAECNKVDAIPFVNIIDNDVQREIQCGLTEQSIKLMAEIDATKMSQMDAYIGIRGGDNSFELSDVPDDKKALYQNFYSQPVHHEIRVKKTKWVVLRYPTPAMSQQAGMSTQSFEDFYFDVCNLDYSIMDKAMDALKSLMDKTDRVRIVSPGTDLSFSIKGINAVKCSGRLNIPDGEVYTAPVRNSVNGTIKYNAPSIEQGLKFENVTLTFKDGKIINATSNYPEQINKIFDVDEGARYVGEFAIGVNPYVTKPMGDILFDEKISGSIHFTPGNCYDDAYNGNQSSLHWDLVLIQNKEYGGGEIYFDDVLIRKDGRFVIDELLPLNPENLIK